MRCTLPPVPVPALVALALAATLAACTTIPPAPWPLAAEITRGAVVVHLSDGTRCVSATPWTEGAGRFGNCPGLAWRITADAHPNVLRRIVEDGFGLLVADGALRPFAVIEVTDAQGRVTPFASPPPEPHR